MCGISLLIYKKRSSESRIKELNGRIVHRGPDDEGYFLSEKLELGHRRLSIIDLSANGHQPMWWKDKYVITYNGEVYNYIEIRKELVTKGYTFSTESDTEVILAAYDYYGKECVTRFNGMWSFSIFDKTKQVVFCSRDRFGVKPFYYVDTPLLFAGASEIKQLVDLLPDKKINEQVVLDYLVLGVIEISHQTFFKNIVSLPPGHNLEYDLQRDTFNITRYYELQINNDIRILGLQESIAHYKQTLADSISLRLRSDVKVGSCLSGGLDSSYITSVAAEAYYTSSKENFIAITASSIDKENDETEWAEKVVYNRPINWITFAPSGHDFRQIIDKVVYGQDEPFTSPSVFMQYYVMAKAREAGCTVMLDGQGGDETLLGYESYFNAYLSSVPFYAKLQALSEITQNSKLTLKSAIQYQLYLGNAIVRKLYLQKRSNFVRKNFLDGVNWGYVVDTATACKSTDSMQYLDITRNSLPHLLKYEDRNSMMHSIESRLPFLDYRAVEAGYSINPTHKIKEGWTKYILRRSAQNILPEDVRWRKIKRGFESPDRLWLQDKDFFLKTIRESQIIGMITDRLPDNPDNLLLWRLFNLARWEQIYNVTI